MGSEMCIRDRLLHGREIAKLEREVSNSGRTIVPLSIYFSDGYALSLIHI